MTAPEALYESTLSSLKLRARGKVRDIYDIDDKHMLIVTTDRLSAFDVILPDPIPGKGRVLTSVSNFWFEKMKHVMPNHLSDIPLEQVVPDPAERAQIEGRAIVNFSVVVAVFWRTRLVLSACHVSPTAKKLKVHASALSGTLTVIRATTQHANSLKSVLVFIPRSFNFWPKRRRRLPILTMSLTLQFNALIMLSYLAISTDVGHGNFG